MDPRRARRHMIEHHLKARGIADPRVLHAFDEVPREAFVPADLADHAYDDRPLGIEANQTISQPFIVAVMVEALRLRPGDKVLEIGTGSGYAAAILGRLARQVFTVERHAVLADIATERLARLGYRNVGVRCGDGTVGWSEHAPFDAIVVAAGGPEVPPTLLRQLAIGGRLVIPVGESDVQQLVRVTRVSATKFHHEDLGDVTFVPLIGAEGWDDPEDGVRSAPS